MPTSLYTEAMSTPDLFRAVVLFIVFKLGMSRVFGRRDPAL